MNNEQIIELIPFVRFNSVSNSQLFQTIDGFYIIFRELWKIYCLSISRFSVTCNCECQTGRRCKNDSFLTFCIQAFSLLCSLLFFFFSDLFPLYFLLCSFIVVSFAHFLVAHFHCSDNCFPFSEMKISVDEAVSRWVDVFQFVL